jgi:uncharacterized protein YbbC (DUF1343 family)
LFGAPWLHSRVVCGALNDSGLPGARFVPVQFTPGASAFAGQRCEGINLIVVDRAKFLPVLAGITVIEVLLREHKSEWQVQHIERLLVNRASFDGLMKGHSAQEVVRNWAHDIEVFEARRRPYLMYE